MRGGYSGDSAIYFAYVADMNFDHLLNEEPGKVHEVYDGLIAGTLKSANGKLLSKKDIKIDGLDGVEIEFVFSANPGYPDRIFKRMVFLNGMIFHYDFWTLSSLKELTLNSREKFFNSFKVVADKNSIRQDTGTDTAYQASYKIGYYIIGPLL